MLAATLLLSLTRPSYERIEDMAWARQAQTQEQRHEQDVKGDKDLGANYAKQVDKEYKESTDKESEARIQRIGASLAAVANANKVIASWGDKRLSQFDYKFKLIEGKDVNAFSLPGGYIYVFDGLMKFVESDDELAGVLAHEISHASFRHIATLQHEQSKLNAIQLPLILLAVFAKGGEGAGTALQLGSLVDTALGSGWSVKAETAADFGGLQYMVKSNYNPTGMLTFMERLAQKERSEPSIYATLGIFRTHPPSKERAQTLAAHMKEFNLPIKRSAVSTTFRTSTKDIPDGVEVVFHGRRIVAYTGVDAKTRAADTVTRLNDFFDNVPDLFEVQAGDEGAILGRRKMIIDLEPQDAAATKQTLPELQADTIKNVRTALFTLGYRVWDVH